MQKRHLAVRVDPALAKELEALIPTMQARQIAGTIKLADVVRKAIESGVAPLRRQLSACPACGGHGVTSAEDESACPTCDQAILVTCAACGGTGERKAPPAKARKKGGA